MNKRTIAAATGVAAVVTFSIAAPVTTIAAPAPSTVAGVNGPDVPIPTTLLGQPVQSASAGAFCDATGICGDAYNERASVTYFGVDCNLGDGWNVDHWVTQGNSGTCKDVDGVYIRQGYRARANLGPQAGQWVTWGSGYHKITDPVNASILVTR